MLIKHLTTRFVKELEDMTQDTFREIFEKEGKGEVLFRAIMGRTKQRLYGVIRRMLSSHEDTDDVLQDTYITAFERLDQFNWQSQLDSWLYRIAVNKALDFLRKSKRKDVEIPKAGTTETPDYSAAEKILLEALEEIPERQRSIFVMRYYEDLSFSEMSRLTGISEGGLRSNYHHAKRKIKEVFIDRGLL